MNDGLRMALFYAGVYSAIGIQMPYFPVWLKAQGMGPTEIGALLAFTYLGKIVFNPLVGGIVDRRGDRRPVMIAVSAGAVICALGFAVASGFPALLLITFLAMGFMASMMPVADNLTLGLARLRGFDYGRVRLWGSIAFIVAAYLGGLLLGIFSTGIVLWLFIGGLVLTFLACLKLPEIETPATSGPPLPLRALLADRTYLIFLAACSLVQISHMTYYGFATLHWRAAGIADWIIGLLWAEGVLAEVALFLFGPAIVGRLGPTGLLIVAAVGCVLRWTVLATTTDVRVLLAVQLLHAATFACMHLGAMHFIHRAAPAKIAVRAQSFYASVTVGLAPGLAMFASGPLYDHFGGHSFLVMAAIGIGATVFALMLARRWHGQELRLGQHLPGGTG